MVAYSEEPRFVYVSFITLASLLFPCNHASPSLITEEHVMPMRGATTKENRRYAKIKSSAKKSGKSTKRAKEIAARTVNNRN